MNENKNFEFVDLKLARILPDENGKEEVVVERYGAKEVNDFFEEVCLKYLFFDNPKTWFEIDEKHSITEKYIKYYKDKYGKKIKKIPRKERRRLRDKCDGMITLLSQMFSGYLLINENEEVDSDIVFDCLDIL